jgi:hypothetical protein
VKRGYVRSKPLVLATAPSETAAYCVRCRDRRELRRARRVTLSNGRPALRGRCADCGTRAQRIVKAG